MAIRVGRWDCSFCGHRGNLGPEKQCASCGKPRGSDVRFYLPENAEVVTDASEIARAKAGPDWTCDYCGAQNSHDSKKCQACGNVKDRNDQELSTTDYKMSEVPRSGDPPEETAAAPKPYNPKKYRNGCGCFVAVILFLFVLGLIGRPKEIELTVVGHAWERSIQVEQLVTVEREDWSLPADARLIRRFRAFHHNEQILDHYVTKTRTVRVKTGEEEYVSGQRDLGNGYFEDIISTRDIYEDRQETYKEPVYRDEPVYETRYRYWIDEWTALRTEKASAMDKAPYWPQGAVESKMLRNGQRSETYILMVRDKKGDPYRFKLELNQWQSFNYGDKVKALKYASNRVELQLEDEGDGTETVELESEEP